MGRTNQTSDKVIKYKKQSRKIYSENHDHTWCMEKSKNTPSLRLLSNEKETDPHRLAQRQKQIDYGKNTIGYDQYIASIPRKKRDKSIHPMTPDKTVKVSKKSFDHMVRRWRQQLHKFDPPELESVTSNLSEPKKVCKVKEDHMNYSPSSDVHDDDVKLMEQDDDCFLDPSKSSIFEEFVEDEADSDDDDLL